MLSFNAIEPIFLFFASMMSILFSEMIAHSFRVGCKTQLLMFDSRKVKRVCRRVGHLISTTDSEELVDRYET